MTKTKESKLEKIFIPAKLCGEVSDIKGKLIGRYIYISKENEYLLQQFCDSWLKSYEADPDFWICWDLETQGLDYWNDEILLFSITANGEEAVIFSPHEINVTPFLDIIREIPYVNQNVPFDSKYVVAKYGIVPKIKLCTMVGAQIGWAGAFPSDIRKGKFSSSYSLDNLVYWLLPGYTVSKEVRNTFIGMPVGKPFSRQQIEYAAIDSLMTYRLVKPIEIRLKNQGLWKLWETVEKPIMQMFVEEEPLGVKVDLEGFKKLYIEKEHELLKMHKKIQEMIVEYVPEDKMPKFPKHKEKGEGFNPTAAKQIINVLKVLGIFVTSTKDNVLNQKQAEVKHPLLEAIIDYRKLSNEVSKNLKGWITKHINPVTECVYPNCNYYKETGRFSYREPPLQTQEAWARHLIKARDHYKIVSADYDQFELRGAAGLSGEEKLMQAFWNQEELTVKLQPTAEQYGVFDVGDFVKAAIGKKFEVPGGVLNLCNEFVLNDVHRITAATALGIPISEVDSTARFLGKCVSTDSWVSTDKGITTLKELLPKKPKPNTFYDLKGVKALTDEGYEDAPQIYYKGFDSGYQIKTKSGRLIKCTDVHQFRTLNKKGDYVWIKAKKLKVGDKLFVRYGDDPSKGKRDNSLLAYADLLGHFIRCGYKDGNDIIFDETKGFLPVLEQLCKKLNCNQPKLLILKKNSPEYLVIRDSNLASKLPEEKLIPSDWMKEFKPYVLETLLSSMFNGGTDFCFPSLELLYQIQNITLRWGANGFITSQTMSGNPMIKYYGSSEETLKRRFALEKFEHSKDKLETWKLACSEKELMKLFDVTLGLPCNTEAALKETFTEEELMKLKERVNRQLRTDEIVSIKPLKNIEFADLSVPSNNTVIYNGIISHNTLNYALSYGAGPPRIQVTLAEEKHYYSIKECTDIFNGFHEGYPKLSDTLKSARDSVLDPGFTSTLLGRKRFYRLPPKWKAKEYRDSLQKAYREASNFIFQAMNADATKISMVELNEIFREKYPPIVMDIVSMEYRKANNLSDDFIFYRPRILYTIHDEIILEVPNPLVEEVSAILKDVMVRNGEKATGYKVPIRVSCKIGNHLSK